MNNSSIDAPVKTFRHVAIHGGGPFVSIFLGFSLCFASSFLPSQPAILSRDVPPQPPCLEQMAPLLPVELCHPTGILLAHLPLQLRPAMGQQNQHHYIPPFLPFLHILPIKLLSGFCSHFRCVSSELVHDHCSSIASTTIAGKKFPPRSCFCPREVPPSRNVPNCRIDQAKVFCLQIYAQKC
jgi:hypothetical protein